MVLQLLGMIVVLICDNLFRNVLGQLAAAAMPQSVTVTPEERDAIERVSSSLFINMFDEFVLCHLNTPCITFWLFKCASLMDVKCSTISVEIPLDHFVLDFKKNNNNSHVHKLGNCNCKITWWLFHSSNCIKWSFHTGVTFHLKTLRALGESSVPFLAALYKLETFCGL